MTEEQLKRLEKYKRTLIAPSTFAYYDRNAKWVEREMEKKGFKNCRCWVSATIVDLSGTIEETILIEGEKE